MKNTITSLFFAAAVLFATTSFAQTNKMSIGFDMGTNITKLRGNYILDNGYLPSVRFSGGVNFQYNILKHLSIKTNIYYEKKSSLNTDNTIGYNAVFIDWRYMGERKKNYHYLTIPLLTQLTFGKKFKFFVNVGPYAGFLIRQTYRYEIDEKPIFYIPSVSNTTNQNERLDWGITTGAGVGFPVKEKWLVTIEVRNNLGLYDTSKRTDNPTIVATTTKINTASLTFGINYLIGAKSKE